MGSENLLISKSVFVLVDKPRGPSSHEVTTYVKNLLGANKAGHAGTLDPQVSGILIIGLNKATKLLRFVAKSKKKYVGVMKLKNPPKNIWAVQSVMDKFVGNISQIPPKHSAVAKRKRTRAVFSFKALEMDGRKILFESEVQAGTYIRNLCVDVGASFGGGYMAELRRVQVGRFIEQDCARLSQLVDASHLASNDGSPMWLETFLKPCEQILTLPSLRLRHAALDMVCRGLPLAVSGVASVESEFARGAYVSMLDEQGRLAAIGIAELDSREMDEMEAGVVVAYPKAVLI